MYIDDSPTGGIAMRYLFSAAIICLLIGTACSSFAATPTAQGLSVTSDFSAGTAVPKQHTADGADQSPPLRWSAVPGAARSIAIVCYDPDAPRGTWYHWLLYNMAPTISLSGNLPKQGTLPEGVMQGTNDFNHLGYNGPAPPPGQKHRYFYRVIALDEMLPLQPGARKDELLKALAGHILAEGSLMGIYSR